MRIRVQPLCLTTYAMASEPLTMLAMPQRHTVMREDQYDERPTLSTDADSVQQALEAAWLRYQNIDEQDRETIDGGRSLMVGDMAKVQIAGGEPEWWICCSLGWHRTVRPGPEIQRIGR